MPLTYTQAGALVWRDFNTDGVPSSGKKSPDKEEIRTWATEVEGHLEDLDAGKQPLSAKLSALVELPLTANKGIYATGGATLATFDLTAFARTLAGKVNATAVKEELGITGAAGALFPPGGIIMWSGSVANIPAGWALCDGTNGTPNLLDRFIVGAGSGYSPGGIGGSNFVALAENQMPQHSHTFSATTSAVPDHQHLTLHTQVFSQWGTGGGSAGRIITTDGSSPQPFSLTSPAGSHSHTVSGTTSAVGGLGIGHENRPPFYALCFIMKLA